MAVPTHRASYSRGPTQRHPSWAPSSSLPSWPQSASQTRSSGAGSSTKARPHLDRQDCGMMGSSLQSTPGEFSAWACRWRAVDRTPVLRRRASGESSGCNCRRRRTRVQNKEFNHHDYVQLVTSADSGAIANRGAQRAHAPKNSSGPDPPNLHSTFPSQTTGLGAKIKLSADALLTSQAPPRPSVHCRALLAERLNAHYNTSSILRFADRHRSVRSTLPHAISAKLRQKVAPPVSNGGGGLSRATHPLFPYGPAPLSEHEAA